MKTGENNPEVINMLLSKVQFLTHNITDIRMKTAKDRYGTLYIYNSETKRYE